MNRNPSKKNKFTIGSIFACAAISFLMCVPAVRAGSSDAIAIRIAPNPNRLSPSRWYLENVSVVGTPKSLSLDGYEAVQDGRTIYANMANITDPSNPGNNSNVTYYTNIFIISYNQNAEKETLGIVSQLIKHLHFNDNMMDRGDQGVCSKFCNINSDCKSTFMCGPANTCVPDPAKRCNDSGNSCPDGFFCNSTSGACEKFCYSDSECADDEICQSEKSKVTRDTKRLADLREIEGILNRHLYNKGTYPALTAGTYLSGRSTSRWPSWKNTLGKELETELPLDPINRFGTCQGFDQETCWNEVNKTFADPTPGDNIFNMPAGSRVYAYNKPEKMNGFCSVDDDDAICHVCSNMESIYFEPRRMNCR